MNFNAKFRLEMTQVWRGRSALAEIIVTLGSLFSNLIEVFTARSSYASAVLGS